MLERLEKIFREVFNDSHLKLKENMTIDDIPGWDSMAHVNLCVAIEEEFNFQLTVMEMATINSIPAIMKVLEERGSG